MFRIAVGIAVMLLLCARPVVAQEVWPESDGTLTESVTWVHGLQRPVFDSGVYLNPSMHLQTVFAGRSVRIGPFTMKFDGLVDPPGSITQSAEFRVRVFARSPQSLSPSVDSPVIGQITRTLSFGQSATEYVDVDLPGGLNALAVELDVDSTTTSVYPNITCLPPYNDDSYCFQAGINPSAVISGIVTVAILYEPPGNCSFSSFSATGIQGTGISLDTMDSSATDTLHDVTIAGGLITDQHSDTNFSHTQTDSKESVVQLKTGVTYFTQLGPVGDVRCSQVDQQANVPDRRTTAGPGRGDVFVLLVNAPFVYWNTNNLSNARYLLPDEPLPPGLDVVQTNPTAENLRTHENLATALALRPQSDLDAIRSLDPLAANPLIDPNAPVTTSAFNELPSNRYLRVTAPFSLGTNAAPIMVEQDHEDSRFSVATIGQEYADTAKSSSQNYALAVLNKATQFGTAYLAGQAAAQAANYVFLNGNATPKQLDSIEGAFKGSIPTLFQDSTTVTTKTTLSDAQLQKQFSTTGNVQSFFIKDTLRPLDFQVYYDTLFGTFAFQEKPSAMGQLTQDVRSVVESQGAVIPQFAWVKTVPQGSAIDVALPASILSQIAALGADQRFVPFSLAQLAPEYMTVRAGATAGFPDGLIMTANGGLSGTTYGATGVYQQAFVVLNATGAVDASILPVLWVTVSVAAPASVGSSNCTRTPNPDSAAPGTDIVTCCTPTDTGQLCNSFVGQSCAPENSVTFYQSFQNGTTLDIGGAKTPLRNATAIVDAPGLFGKGMDGATTYDIPYLDFNGASINFANPGSLSYWFKNDSNVGAEPLSFVALDSNAHVKLVVSGGSDALEVYIEYADADNSGAATSATLLGHPGMSGLATGQWHLVVVNWTFDEIAISVDGGPPTTGAVNWLAGDHVYGPNVDELIFAAGTMSDPGQYYPGAGDEVVVMNRPMTDEEIQWYWAQRVLGGPNSVNPAVDHFNAASVCSQ